MKKKLVIIQDVPTQFDAPLYNLIASEASFSLFVIYTAFAREDSEIGRMPQWDHIHEHGYQHHFLNKSERESANLVVERVRELAPNHVIVSGYWPKLHRDIMHSLKRHRVSVGLRSDNTIRHSKLGGVRGFFKRLYLRRLLARYDVWHPVGQQAADYLIHLSSEVRPVSFFPYNVDTNWFREQVKLTRTHRAQQLLDLGFAEDSYILLGVMKWSEREDPMTLLLAFEQYSEYNPLARLILVGDGPLRKEVYKCAKKLGKKIHVPGYSRYSRLPYWYGLADVFIHPAPNEPWGVSVSEALASGVPVIASSGVGAAIEQVSPGHNGYIFEQRNAVSLVDALTQWQAVAESKSANQITQHCEQALENWRYQTTIKCFQTVLQHD